MDTLYTFRVIKLGHFQKDKLTQTKEATIYSELATFLVMEGENKSVSTSGAKERDEMRKGIHNTVYMRRSLYLSPSISEKDVAPNQNIDFFFKVKFHLGMTYTSVLLNEFSQNEHTPVTNSHIKKHENSK